MNKKRKLAIVASLLVVAVATASGVYALFTDQTQATGNVITAGDVNPGATPSGVGRGPVRDGQLVG